MNQDSTAPSAVADIGSNGRDAHQSVAKVLTRNRDRLMRDLKTVIDDAQALLKEAAQSSNEYVTDIPAYLEKKLGRVNNNFHRARAAIEQKAKFVTGATDRYVRENPWKSAAYVTAASLLIGILLLNAWRPASGRRGEPKNET